MANQGDEAKLAELILYVAEKLREDAPGGATKLNKILYFAEFRHMRKYGRPITGVPYQKLQKGPAPRRLRPVRDKLIADEDAKLEQDDYFGKQLDRLIPQRAADRSVFANDELETVDWVVKALWGKTAQEVSDLSHEDMGWKMVPEGEDIIYETAYLPSRVVMTDRMREHAAELAKRYGSN